MTQINLLPWRELKREQDKKMFTTMILVGAIVAACIVFLINYYASSLVDNQIARNQMLQKEITIFNTEIQEIKSIKKTKEALISRMLVIQNLQSTRTLMVHLFDELIKIMPEGVYVTKLARQHDIVTLWGYSESNTHISILMRNIENNAWIRNPKLTQIKKMDENKRLANNEFTLSFTLKPQGW